MNASANGLLLLAALATVLLGIVLAAPLPTGPDRAGISIVCFVLQVPRWGSLAVVLGMCVAQGAFPWPASRAVQYLLVLTVHVLLGVGSILCGVAVLEGFRGVPVPDWMVRVLSFAPLAIPSSQILFAVWFLNPTLRYTLEVAADRTVINYSLAAFALLVFVFGSVGALAFRIDSQHSARRQAENTARREIEAEAKANTEEEGFRALSPESGLMEWFQFTEYGHTEEHRLAARKALLKRPNLAKELSVGIASADTEVSRKLMYFVGELPNPPVQVAEAVRGQAARVIAIARAIDPGAADSRDVLYEKAHSIAVGVQAAAFGLQRSGINLGPELQAMAEACHDREKASPRDIADGCERIVKYFSQLAKQHEVVLKLP